MKKQTGDMRVVMPFFIHFVVFVSFVRFVVNSY